MKAGGWICAAGLLALGCGLMAAQDASPGPKAADASAAIPAGAVPAKRQVSFTFDRKGVAVVHYRMLINEDGSGVYEGQEIPVATAYGNPVNQAPTPFRHTISISQPTSQKIFSLAEKLNRFDVTCASKLKNIADTGIKTLAYSGRDGSGSCTYNYSDNKDVQSLTEVFLGIAETMDIGRRLDLLHRFDRLGLDPAMKFLSDEVASGRALEIGTIERSLRSIAQDAGVMARVRTRATALLNQATGPATP